MQFRGPEKAEPFTRDPAGVAVRPFIGTRPPTDAAEQCVAQIDNVEQCTAAVWFDGFTYNRSGGALTFPLVVEWKLFVGVGGCMPDLDPPRAVSIFKTEDDLKTRSGRLFQLDCTVHRTMWLCARVINDIGTTQVQANLRFIFWPLSGRPETVVGTAVG